MIKKFLIGSLSLAKIVEVEGDGMTENDARRNAVNSARSLLHIPDPVAIVDNHYSAMIVRRAVEQKHRELVQSIVPQLAANVPFWRQREDRAALYAK